MAGYFKCLMGAAGLAAAIAVPATAMAQTELSLANFIPPRHVMNAEVFFPFAERVAKATHGEVTVKVYPSGELGAGAERQLNRVLSGVADIVFGVQGYTSSQFPRTLAAELPGLYPDPVEGVARLWDHFDLVAGDYGRVKVLAVWYNSPMVLLTRERQIRKMEDLQGLTIRAPSTITAQAVEAWGANPVTMPVPEIYNAMQTGVIDGVLIGADAIKSFRLQEVSSSATFGLPTAASSFFLLMNKDSWEGLSDDQRAAIDAISGKDLSIEATEAYQKPGIVARQEMEAADDFTVIDLEPAESRRMVEALAPVRKALLADLEGQGIDGETILSTLAR